MMENAAALLRETHTHNENRLAGIVHRFATATGVSGRVSELRGIAALQALMRRIDETVLPREIEIVSAKKVEARLLVANRRLIRVETGGRPVSTDQESAADPVAAAQMFVRRLQPVLAQAGPVHFRAVRHDLNCELQDMGCRMDSLSAVAGVPMLSATTDDPMHSFAVWIEPVARAWIRTDRAGNVSEQHGPKDKRDALLAFVRDLERTADTGPKPALRNKPSCTVIPLPDGDILVIVDTAQGGLSGVLPGSLMAQVMAEWRTCFRS